MKVNLTDVLLAVVFVALFSFITDVLTDLAEIGAADVKTIATATGAQTK